MPRFRRQLELALITLALSAAGCGGDGGSDDAGNRGDGGLDASAADAPPASCDRQGFTPSSEAAERDFDLEVLFYTGATAAERFNIDFYFSLGATDDAQTIELSGEGLDTCAECVLLRADCGALLCETPFMAQSGTLTIDAMGGEGQAFTGSLQNAVFREVEIASGTQETTVISGGQSWCIDDYAFDVVVTVPRRPRP